MIPMQNIFLVLVFTYLLTDFRQVFVKSEKYQALEIVNKSPRELIELRGFKSEVHYAHTPDGYYIHVVRIVNPLIKKRPLKRPVVFNHGLSESSTIYLLNSKGVKPLHCNVCDPVDIDSLTNSTHHINGPMMLANNGYDVWLMSMRGTDWSLKHDKLDWRQDEFWDYCLDDFALVDVPTVIDYVSKKTGSPKVAYIGHSQATFSVFGLLAMKPHYADKIEPVFALAPVAYFDHITSIMRLTFTASLLNPDKDMHGPVPKSAKKYRLDFATLCSGGFMQKMCDFSYELIGGRGKDRPQGYYSHLPYYSSLKVLRQFGQLVVNRRFMMYDYGFDMNNQIYGQPLSPSYPIDKIRSKSLCLFSTETDSLSHPEDVERFKSELTVPLFHDEIIKGDFNHFDLVTDSAAQRLVWAPILLILDDFERKTGVCSKKQKSQKWSKKAPPKKDLDKKGHGKK